MIGRTRWAGANSSIPTGGSSTIVFAGVGELSIEGNSTLTLGPAMVVHGKTGTIGGPLVTRGPNKLINQGLIAADEPAGTVTIRTTQFENTGTLAATAANSRLVVRVVPFNNAGTIQELNGGKVLINP